MGDVSRKTTTRTWQRPQRPDSEKRDPEGGVTDRRDRRIADRPRPATSLTNYLCRCIFMLVTNTSAALDSRASHLKPIAAPSLSLAEETSIQIHLETNDMADGAGWGVSS